MRISDEDLSEMVRDSYCKDAGCKRCNSVKDLRDLRKLASDLLLTMGDCNCDISCGTHDETCEAIAALKTHLEGK